jgi:AraC-like DNA-binding protein
MSCSYPCEEARVCIRPSDPVERQRAQWQDLRTERVAIDEREPFVYRFKRPYHLLITTEQAERLTHHGEVLGVMPGHALTRSNGTPTPPLTVTRGGLSGWRRNKVADFIEEHLAEDVRLSVLAGLVDLSPYHFARAFKQSFGVPPHRYHVGRRIERAKALLAQQARSVTEVALMLGFAETSSFSATFRRATGTTPTAFRRSLA